MLPPLNLSAGPAVSGGGTISTPIQSGDFTFYRDRQTALERTISLAPVLAVLVVATFLVMRR